MTDSFESLRSALADRYTIERELGAGGMATVYLAHDIKHDRKVAVKVLRPELAAVLGTERFLQEIKIAAQLHHPHILQLYDSGEADGFLYYVMPYVKGESLRDRLTKEGELPIADAVRVLKEVVDALAKAHSEGVVHRDIKPDNVMISDRHAVVTDFGIAKAVSEATGRQQLTTAGVALGTPAYMAPEQAAADPHIDHRADIYAVGALAYELLTGRPPFTGTTQQAVLAAHVTQTPELITNHRETVSSALAQLVMKCLEKKPADRWQTAEEMLQQLEAMSTPSGGMTPTAAVTVSTSDGGTTSRGRLLKPALAAAAVIALAMVGFLTLMPSNDTTGPKRLAVLPFENATGDSARDITAEGLTRELITALTNADARVIGYRSVARYSGSDKPLQEMAGELSADVLVFGFLQRMGAQVQLSMELTDPATGENLWANTYSSPADELRSLTNRIARELAEETNVEVSPEHVTMLAAAGRVDPEAFNAYLLGKHQAQRYTRDGFERSVEHFARAIELDGSFAPAWAGLAYAYLIAADYRFFDAAEAHRIAQTAIDTALALDGNLGLAYLARARLAQQRDWDWSAAEQAYLRAIELSPSSEAHELYGWFLAQWVGRLDEGVAALERAVEIDPTSALMHGDLAWQLMYQGDVERAETHIRLAQEFDSTYAESWATLADVHTMRGEYEEALAALDRFEELGGETWPGDRSHVYARMGQSENAFAGLERWRNTDRYGVAAAMVYVGLGEPDSALALLEQATNRRLNWRWHHYFWEPIRDDPRFQALLERIGVARQ